MSKEHQDGIVGADENGGTVHAFSDVEELINSQKRNDDLALSTFLFSKTIEYFNEAAKKTSDPIIAAEDEAVADMLEQSAAVFDRLTHSEAAQPTAEDRALVEKMFAWHDKAALSGEAQQIQAYQASKIAEFIAAHPESWKRLAKTADPFVVMAIAKNNLKPSA